MAEQQAVSEQTAPSQQATSRLLKPTVILQQASNEALQRVATAPQNTIRLMGLQKPSQSGSA